MERPNRNWPDRYVNRSRINVKLGPSEDWQRKMREKARGYPERRPAPERKAKDASDMPPAGLPSRGSGPWRSTTSSVPDVPARDPDPKEKSSDEPRPRGRDRQSKRGLDPPAADASGAGDAGKDPVEKKRKGEEKGKDAPSDTTARAKEAEKKLTEALAKGSEKKTDAAPDPQDAGGVPEAEGEGDDTDVYLEVKPVGPDPNDLAACPLSPGDGEPDGDAFQGCWRTRQANRCCESIGLLL